MSFIRKVPLYGDRYFLVRNIVFLACVYVLASPPAFNLNAAVLLASKLRVLVLRQSIVVSSYSTHKHLDTEEQSG